MANFDKWHHQGRNLKPRDYYKTPHKPPKKIKKNIWIKKKGFHGRLSVLREPTGAQRRRRRLRRRELRRPQSLRRWLFRFQARCPFHFRCFRYQFILYPFHFLFPLFFFSPNFLGANQSLIWRFATWAFEVRLFSLKLTIDFLFLQDLKHQSWGIYFD